jgi:hypothetical protein
MFITPADVFIACRAHTKVVWNQGKFLRDTDGKMYSALAEMKLNFNSPFVLYGIESSSISISLTTAPPSSTEAPKPNHSFVIAETEFQKCKICKIFTDKGIIVLEIEEKSRTFFKARIECIHNLPARLLK